MPWLDKELDDTMPAKRHVGPMSKSWHDRLGLRPNNSMEPPPLRFGDLRPTRSARCPAGGSGSSHNSSRCPCRIIEADEPGARSPAPAALPARLESGAPGAGEVAEADVEERQVWDAGKANSTPSHRSTRTTLSDFREVGINRASAEQIGAPPLHDRPGRAPGMVRFVTPRHLRREAFARSDGTPGDPRQE